MHQKAIDEKWRGPLGAPSHESTRTRLPAPARTKRSVRASRVARAERALRCARSIESGRGFFPPTPPGPARSLTRKYLAPRPRSRRASPFARSSSSMFASASASLASRVPVRLGERRGRSAAKVNTSARAATTYTLDGKGCAGARTGDTGEFKNNIVAYKKRDAPACPIKPIAVTELCASHEGGKFKMLDAIFEQVGDDLYIYGCKPDECVRDAALPRTARASSRQDDIIMAFPSAVARGPRINRPLPRAGLGLAETVFFAVLFSSPLSRPSRPASPRVPRPAAVAHPPPLRFAAPPRPARRAAARTPPSTSRWTAAPSRPRRGRNCASSPGSSSASAGSASRYSATSSRTREAKKERPREREKRAREEGRARKDARGKPRARRGEREVSP